MRLSPPLFGFVRLFFEIFQSLQRVPFLFFWCFAPEWMLKKPKRHYETVKNYHFLFFLKILKFFRNFSMSPKGRSFIFLIFCNKLDFEKAQGVPPFTILKTLRFLSLGYGADFRRSRLVCLGGNFPRFVYLCFVVLASV